MYEKISVRLVPKRNTASYFSEYASHSPRRSDQASTGDEGHASEALGAIKSMSIAAERTTGNAIHAQITPAQVESLFGVTLTEAKDKNLVSRYLTTKESLRVPAALAHEIDFAYIPTPPQYFSAASSSPPPRPNSFFLTLEDVSKQLCGHLCHQNGWRGSGVKVVMVDSGFADHPYFNGNKFNIRRMTSGAQQDPRDDREGHGTGECANLLTMAPDCEFVGIKQGAAAADALEDAIAQNPAVINVSWGWNVEKFQNWKDLKNNNANRYYELTDIARIINDAINARIIVVCAAGNGHEAFPACMEDVIAVGGGTIRANGEVCASNCASSFSSRLYVGREVPDFCGIMGEANPVSGHIMLPVPPNSARDGQNLDPSWRGQGWGLFSGTSAAAPQVAGVIALMLSINPNLDIHQVKNILTHSCLDITSGSSYHGHLATQGKDPATGSGLVNAYGACSISSHALRSAP